MFKKIKKRDGRIVKFRSEKITQAIAKAGEATGEFGRKIAEKLTLKVLESAQKKISPKTPTVEEIQDIVEEVLLSSPYHKTAKAYIVYRAQHTEIRQIVAKSDVSLVEQYLEKTDWQVNENSNMAFSLQGLNNYLSSEVSKIYWLNKIYSPEIRKAYERGDFHIHDLGLISVYTYYGKEVVIAKIDGLVKLISFEKLYELIKSKEKLLNKKDEAFTKYPKNVYVLDKNGWTKVKKVVKKKKNREMRFIKNRGGRSVIVTDNHPIITEQGEKTAIKVKKSDKLFTVDLDKLLQKYKISFKDLLKDYKGTRISKGKFQNGWHYVSSNKPIDIPDKVIYDITTESGTLIVNGMWNHNCVGWDLEDLLMEGFTGVSGKVETKPARHFRAALGQVVNFFYTLQGEAAGAQAFSFDAQTPITIKRNEEVESITLEMLFEDYKHQARHLNKSEVIFTENIYREYLLNDIDKRKYLDSRLPTEPVLFQFDKIEVLTEKGFMPLRAISRHKIKDKNDELLIVETEDGNVLRVSRSHPMILVDGSIKRADKLAIGDEILSSDLKIDLSEKIELESDFAYLIGFMIAEGCWGHQTREYSIISQKKNTKEREKVENILNKLKIPHFENGEFNIVFGTTSVGRFIRNHLRLQEGSYKKNLPQFVFSLKKKNIGDLISGLIDGDGDVDKKRIVRIHSTSYTLLMQLKQVLGILGISSTVRFAFYKNAKENYKDAYVIRFRVREKDLSFFRQSIKLSNIKTKTKESPKFSSKVVKVTKAKYDNEFVYDITTDNKHFLINNIVVHNSNFDTLLAPFIRYDKLSYPEVKQAMQEFLFNMNIPTRVGFQCVSEDTEILTPSGWKSYNEVNKGDVIKTFNLENGVVEDKKVRSVFRRKYAGIMYNLKNRIQDQLISPKHKVVRKKFQTERFILEPIEEVLKMKSPFIIPVSAENSNQRAKISDEQIKLMAWIIGEGSIEKPGKNYRSCYRISIYQSAVKNQKKYQEIKKLLDHFHFQYSEYTQKGLGQPVQRIRLNAESSQAIHKWFGTKETIKIIPQQLLNMSQRQSRLFIDTYLKTDGFEECKIVTSDLKILDDLQTIAFNAGYSSTVLTRKPTIGTKLLYVLRLIKHKETYINSIKKVKYSGIIWSVHTENETIIARRNGKVFITGNTPYTNLTFDLNVPETYAEHPVIVGGKLLDRTYKDFQEEMNMLNKAFLEVATKGDAKSRVFTFPIPTYNITDDFDWNNPIVDLLAEVTARYGLPYFSNFVSSDMKPSDVRSMCCRLRLDLTELKKRGGGYFGASPQTGSIGVVTINMPRLGYLSKTEDEFLERLEKVMILAKNSLEIKRKVLEKLTDRGLYPYTKFYLRAVKGRFKEYWKNHFSTIGLVGMNEACLNLFGEDIGSEKGRKFALKVLSFMRNKLLEFQKETGNNYNLEATPAEGTSYRLALRDKEKFSDIICANEEEYKKGAEPYYTNSTQLPVNYTDDIFEALDLQDEIQTKYTGGTTIHLFAGEKIDNKESVKSLVKKVCQNYHLPYFTITPTFSICPVHKYIAGEHYTCPKCGAKCEVYSRSVGYLRPVSQWNKGKQEEFKERKTFKINKKNK